MKNNKIRTSALLALAVSSACASAGASEVEPGFIEGSSITLQAINYYFMRDYSGLPHGAGNQAKAEEWAQGFILNAKSGYTRGTVGVGVDVIGMAGFKLDSSPDRVNTGLLPARASGKAPDNFSRMGVAVKARLSKTELKVGEQTPNLPVLTFSPIRLLPPTYLGASLVSKDIDNLTLQAGQFRSGSMLNRAGRTKMQAKLGSKIPAGNLPWAKVSSDRFNYAGADYAFNNNRSSVGVWHAELKDIYQQTYYTIKHSEPVGNWVLGATLGLYDSKENGDKLAGKIDNRAFYSLLSAKRGGSTFYVGFQSMHGRDGMPRVFNNISPLGNEVPTYEFADAKERSWQVRHDYNFAQAGIPGLVSTVRYLHGSNIDRSLIGKSGSGKEWERDIDLGYTVQSGMLKDLNVKVRNVMARSNNRPNIDENRLVISYTWKLL